MVTRPSPGPRTAARLGWGTLLLGAPSLTLRLLGGEPTPAARKVARVLGIRHVLQALGTRRAGGDHRYLLAAVDGAHAASAVAFSVFDRRWRRAALTDAAVAACFGLTTARGRR